MLKALNLRNRQRKQRLISCPGVYGIGETPKKIINFTESQYCRPDTVVDSSVVKVVPENIGPSKRSHLCESLLQESQL